VTADQAPRAAQHRPTGPSAALEVTRRVGAHVRRHAVRDGALLLASGVAFDGLLAVLPLLLLVIAVASIVLPLTPGAATADVVRFVAQLLPNASESSHQLLASVLRDIVRTRAELGAAAALGFVWFASRLFATLRSVMARVFEEPEPRKGWRGVLFDLWLTVVAAAFGAAWVAVSALLAAVSAAGGRWLANTPLAAWAVPRPAELFAAHALALASVTAIFYSLYRALPRRHVPKRSALVAAVAAGVAFEAARWVFGAAWSELRGLSVYTGTVAAVVLVMFWAWYAALIFILGGEVLEGVEWERAGGRPLPPARGLGVA
jgi:membrane protein